MIKGAVLGSPISHSLSPVLHTAAFEFLEIQGSYEAIEVPSGTLRDFIESKGSGFDYLSLTMPLKEEVVSLGISSDSQTQRIQSGNTLINRNGSWTLASTDGSGCIAALKNIGLTNFESVLILGAGGTARAVAGALDTHTKNLHVLGRSSTREEALRGAVTQAQFEFVRWSTSVNFEEYDVVINTTPAGAADILSSSIPPRVSTTLFDVIYKPWPTELARRWLDCGGRVISGLELLLYQGIDQIELVLESSIDRQGMADFIRRRLIEAAK